MAATTTTPPEPVAWSDPRKGSFWGTEPLGFNAGDSNLTRYVGNDPVNATDPSGLVETPVSESINYTDKTGKARTGMLEVLVGGKNNGTIQFNFTNSSGINADVKFLQFIGRKVFKDEKEIKYTKEGLNNGNTAYNDVRNLVHFFGERWSLDTDSTNADEAYMRAPPEFTTNTKVKFNDSPKSLAPPIKKYDKSVADFETYLVIGGKVVYRVTWNGTETVVDGKWTPLTIAPSMVKGEKVTNLPKYAQGDKLFGGWKEDKDGKITGAFEYNNPISKENR
jgi:hypothetical protein